MFVCVANAVVEIECSQQVEAGEKMAANDIERRPRSCMIEVVKCIYKRCVHTIFGVFRYSDCQSRVFRTHKSVIDRN